MKTVILEDILLSLRNYYSRPHRPLAAHINLTEQCNLKCAFCELAGDLESDKRRDELSLDRINDITRQLTDWGVKRLYLGGGEPLIRRDLWDILDNVARLNLNYTALFTNGTLLARMDKRQRGTLKRAVSALSISLDSHDPKIHNAARGTEGAFSKVMSFMEGSYGDDLPPLYVTSVITRDTFRGIPALIRFLSRYKIRHVGFQPINFRSNYPHYDAIEDKDRFLLRGEQEIAELMELIQEGIDVSRGLKISTNLDLLRIFLREYFFYSQTDTFFFNRLLKNFICSNVFNYIYIDSTGNLLRCPLVSGTEIAAGEDLKTAWRRHAFSAKKWAMQRKFYPACKSCHCGFASNLRCCLIYHGISNLGIVRRLFGYYMMRSARL